MMLLPNDLEGHSDLEELARIQRAQEITEAVEEFRASPEGSEARMRCATEYARFLLEDAGLSDFQVAAVSLIAILESILPQLGLVDKDDNEIETPEQLCDFGCYNECIMEGVRTILSHVKDVDAHVSQWANDNGIKTARMVIDEIEEKYSKETNLGDDVIAE